MSKTLSIGTKARASMALLAATLGAAAPVATVSPSAPNALEISQTRAPNAPTQSMSRAQAIQANQALGILDGFGGFRVGPNTNIHTFPAWSQRKARKAARQTGRKIQKRYKR